MKPYRFDKKYFKRKRLKSLVAMAAGVQSQAFINSVIATFPASHFDILIFSHDNTVFEVGDDSHCKQIQNLTGQPMRKYDFAKRYLSPNQIQQYEYLFLWDDDADLTQFDPMAYLEVVRQSRFELSMPAYTRQSFFSHPVTLQHPDSVARYTDFVEISFPVFHLSAWKRFYKLLNLYDLPYPDGGGAYDDMAFTYCRILRQGIVDAFPITHHRPVNVWDLKSRRVHHLQSKHFHRWPCAQRISLAYLNQYSEEALEQLIEDYWTTLFDMRATMLEFEQLDQTLVQIINLGRTGVLPVDLPEPIPIRRGYQPVHEGHVFYQPEAHDLLLPKQ